MLALGWIIKPVTLCMKCIILTASKCSTKEADVVVKDNATKNVVLGCVKIEMVDVKGIAADDGKFDQTRSAGDQNATINPVHAGKDICVHDDAIQQSVRDQSIDDIPCSTNGLSAPKSKSEFILPSASAIEHHNEL